jgi:hypothetical protein
VTPSEFRESFPDGEFNSTGSLPDSYIQKFLDAAAPDFNVKRWGKRYSEGLACNVAHRIVVSKAQAAKSISQADANDVVTRAISGAVSMSKDPEMLRQQARDPFLRTTYGQRYAFLRDLVGRGGVTVP